MAGQDGKYNGVISAVIFVAMEIAAIVMLSSSSSMQNIWVNRISHRCLGAVWKSGENIRNYFSLDGQNKALAQQNMELSRIVRMLREREASFSQNAVYDTLSGHFRYIPATVVKASRNSQHNYIILDKGSADGVRPEDGIITASGVVGIVKATDRNFSYGLTLMNPNVSVSARIGMSGTVAPLVWDGKSTHKAILDNIPLHYSFKIGDTVWTSGFSSVFPPDIPVGTIGRVSLVDGSRNTAEVNLFQDFSTLRYVSVAGNLDKETIKELETEIIDEQ